MLQHGGKTIGRTAQGAFQVDVIAAGRRGEEVVTTGQRDKHKMEGGGRTVTGGVVGRVLNTAGRRTSAANPQAVPLRAAGIGMARGMMRVAGGNQGGREKCMHLEGRMRRTAAQHGHVRKGRLRRTSLAVGGTLQGRKRRTGTCVLTSNGPGRMIGSGEEGEKAVTICIIVLSACWSLNMKGHSMSVVFGLAVWILDFGSWICNGSHGFMRGVRMVAVRAFMMVAGSVRGGTLWALGEMRSPSKNFAQNIQKLSFGMCVPWCAYMLRKFITNVIEQILAITASPCATLC